MRTIIVDTTVVTQDAARTIHARADLLIEDGIISAIGPDLPVPPDASLIDGRGHIAMPGLVNAHLHTWQTFLRGLGSDWVGDDYFQIVHERLAPAYTPEDSATATFLGALNQLNNGTTTVFDWCHNASTLAHSEASIDALDRSGIRAVFGHGTTKPAQAPGRPHFSRVGHEEKVARRIRAAIPDGHPRLTMALSILGPDYSKLEVTRHDLALAAELGVMSSAHVWGAANRLVPGGYRALEPELAKGTLHNVVHATGLHDDELRLLLDHGASFTATPVVEIGESAARPLLGRLAALGGAPSLGVDSELLAGGNMLELLRRSLDIQRLLDGQDLQRRIDAGDDPIVAKRLAASAERIANAGGSPLAQVATTSQDALDWGTLYGAKALGLADVTGSLERGKAADIVLLDVAGLASAPLADPVSFIVHHATTNEVATVLVGGQIVKHQSLLRQAAVVDHLLPEYRESAERIAHDAGIPRHHTGNE